MGDNRCKGEHRLSPYGSYTIKYNQRMALLQRKILQNSQQMSPPPSPQIASRLAKIPNPGPCIFRVFVSKSSALLGPGLVLRSVGTCVTMPLFSFRESGDSMKTPPGRSNSLTVDYNDEDLSPIARVQSLPSPSPRNSAIQAKNEERFKDDSGVGKRRNSWLRSIQHKFSHNSTIPAHGINIASATPAPNDPLSKTNERNTKNSTPTATPVQATSTTPTPRDSTSTLREPSVKPSRCSSTTETPGIIPELKSYSMKSVAFAPAVFSTDPPQQIPPVKPRKGNVEFLPSGNLKVNFNERVHEMDLPPYLEPNHNEITMEASRLAHQTATRLHNSISGKSGLFGRLSSINSGNDAILPETYNTHFSCVDEASTREYKNTLAEASSLNGNSEEESLEKDEEPASPEAIYTRCCHLREILPIRSMLRQLQGQVPPLPSLHISNYKPTMIEILAFSDFLTVMPVINVSLDNLYLTGEMVQLILKGLQRTKHLSQLTFVNTTLRERALEYLCSFMVNNKTLTLLNLELRPEKARKPATREDMNWELVGKTLEARGGLDALYISGCSIASNDLSQLLKRLSSVKMLGLGSNNLSVRDISNVVEFVNTPKNRVIGIDLSNNDMSKCFHHVSQLFRSPRLFRLLLRNTNLTLGDNLVRDTVNIRTAEASNLRVLSLAENKGVYPEFIDGLIECLPHFAKLTKLELDSCGLTSDSVIMLCEALVRCPALAYVDISHNEKIIPTSAEALCVAVHLSRTICTIVVDDEDWPDNVKQRLSNYCLQNLERSTTGKVEDDDDDSRFPEFKDFRKKLTQFTKEVGASGADGVDHKPKESISRIISMRGDVRKRMEKLILQKAQGILSTTNREILIRLFLYEGALDRLLSQYAVDTGHFVSLISGSDDSPAAAEEKVDKMNEDNNRPLSRKSSSQSIVSLRSLKKQEQEEAHLHRIGTYLQSAFNSETEEVDSELLRRLLLGNESKADDLTPQELASHIRKLHAIDLETLIN